jgi:pyrimidine operon attenuation protein/uracil phosphoribosyltransferase|tara:strand:+ start:757 stop:1254 length:498 start_codon:yes stop_codon:yes gene_type:complete
MNRTQILSCKQIEQKLTRMAWQIYEANYKETSIVLAGINGNGYVLSKRLAKLIESISSITVILTEVIIDKKELFNSPIQLSIGEQEFRDKVVVLVDDVLNSGKTMIYGVKHFLKTPVKMIKVTALIDREHHRFPIRTDYAGLVLSTSIKDHIAVELGEYEGVYLQ